MIDEFEKLYGEALVTDILEFMVDCDPYRLIPHTEGNPFVYDNIRIFMYDNKHVLLQVESRETLDREGGNHQYTGRVSVDGDNWVFSVTSGNWNGTDIDEWYKE